MGRWSHRCRWKTLIVKNWSILKNLCFKIKKTIWWWWDLWWMNVALFVCVHLHEQQSICSTISNRSINKMWLWLKSSLFLHNIYKIISKVSSEQFLLIQLRTMMSQQKKQYFNASSLLFRCCLRHNTDIKEKQTFYFVRFLFISFSTLSIIVRKQIIVTLSDDKKYTK